MASFFQIIIFILIGAKQCVCLVDELGNRTMRPCLSSAVKLQVCANLCLLFFEIRIYFILFYFL